MDEMQWNWISCQFDRELRKTDDKTGSQLICIFLDRLLQDSCSQDVRNAFERALRKFFEKSKK